MPNLSDFDMIHFKNIQTNCNNNQHKVEINVINVTFKSHLSYSKLSNNSNSSEKVINDADNLVDESQHIDVKKAQLPSTGKIGQESMTRNLQTENTQVNKKVGRKHNFSYREIKSQLIYASKRLISSRKQFALQIYITFLTKYGNWQDRIFPSIETIARQHNCCWKTAQRAMSDLHNAGLVLCTRRGKQQSNLYIINHDILAEKPVLLEGYAPRVER